jgi:hypothetical protein
MRFIDWFIAKTNFIGYNISVEISCAIILSKENGFSHGWQLLRETVVLCGEK